MTLRERVARAWQAEHDRWRIKAAAGSDLIVREDDYGQDVTMLRCPIGDGEMNLCGLRDQSCADAIIPLVLSEAAREADSYGGDAGKAIAAAIEALVHD